MNLTIRGTTATPRRESKAQGWQANSRASRGPRPNDVPELHFGKLGDSEDEDVVYEPLSKSPLRLGPPDSSSTVSWGSPISKTPLTFQNHQPPPWEEKTIPENLPAPSERYKDKYKAYATEMKMNYKQHSQRAKGQNDTQPEPVSQPEQGFVAGECKILPVDDKAFLQQCYTSPSNTFQQNMRKLEAEELAAEKRKQAVVEQIMIDQLSRAVISDPEQNVTLTGQVALSTTGSAPLRFKNRSLHDTKVRTTSALTESLLSNKLRFDARILSRNGRDACRELLGFFFAHDGSLTIYEYRHFGKNRSNALPFIKKGVYSHQHGRKKGAQYQIHDFNVGSNLTFATTDQNLPESIKQKATLTVRITGLDEVAKNTLLAHFPVKNQVLKKQEVEDQRVLRMVQGLIKEKMGNRGVRTITGLGKYFRNLEKSGNGVLQKAELQLALKTFHLDIPNKEFEGVWLILDENEDGQLDYGEFIRGIVGEMSEYRKSFVRKAYVKLDPNKTGSISITDINKFYCVKGHPKVISGDVTEEQLRAAFITTLQEVCKDKSEISYSEFEDFYEGLSIEITEDEDFINILKHSWGI
ncbi:calcyphosin-2 isoform X1 [Erpetoichthys calabaricus]|uniref:Calcyphosine 2 n=2 Tax=Erpetoichthys calabaricus TaxID=27687 RepID=A0A8C4RMB9_ERPCA|nr:calcyphosin-2 isoform X1 [Erpetoichthys calabaricus]